MQNEEDCKCMRIGGQLEAVRWNLWPRYYQASPGVLALDDWNNDPHIWLYYVDSSDGILPDDDVLRSTNPRYWSIHNVQRYFVGQLHCEQVLFTYQYPNIRMPSRLGSYLWKTNTALKLPSALYIKELNMSLDTTLKKMVENEAQMHRLIICDQLVKIAQLDHHKRQTFFRLVQDIMSKMTTDEEKCKVAKLLQDLDVPELKMPERCSTLVKEFEEKFGQDIYDATDESTPIYENPYIVDKELLEENERKLKALLATHKRSKKVVTDKVIVTGPDPKRPWRTQTNREKLLRIDSDLRRHLEKAADAITPMTDADMKELMTQCLENSANQTVRSDRLRETVDEARRNLPNFQYRKIENSTATCILLNAHEPVERQTPNQNMVQLNSYSELQADEDSVPNLQNLCSGKHVPRHVTRQCFLRSLGEMRNLRVLALEYAHLADSTGAALISLLPVIRRPHFRLQLICRENQTPGRADAAMGVGGHHIPDTAWRRVNISCPDLYLLMAFFRVRDYDNIRRFLTPSIPLRETHLQYGIDMYKSQRQDSDLSCFVRHIAGRYGSTLVTLSIHQWRGVTFPLRRIIELMPSLMRILYIGVVDQEDLKCMLNMIACGVMRKLKQVNIQVQDDEKSRSKWETAIAKLNEEFNDIIALYDIEFCLTVYKN
ncbi:unnamed protein product [Leptosia nina]|uniref:Uncharacterized protein n=1 Tax=Leptosia nina TaxID=320188 RepID=A0AAV1K1I3_9NEOP